MAKKNTKASKNYNKIFHRQLKVKLNFPEKDELPTPGKKTENYLWFNIYMIIF